MHRSGGCSYRWGDTTTDALITIWKCVADARITDWDAAGARLATQPGIAADRFAREILGFLTGISRRARGS